jgi:hypothetical protein
MTENAMTPDIIASRERVRLFVEKNKVRADNSKAVCGDGRFTPEQSRGYIRMFGGDEGILLAIEGALNKLSIHIKPKELVARVSAALRSVRGEDAAMGVHTDKHNLESGGIGCGFIAKAVEGEAKHEAVSPEDALELHTKVLEGKHEEVVLDRRHAEQAVLLVYGRDWTINSFDEELDEMYFVVDMDRVKDLIKQVVPGLGRISGLTIEAVEEQFQCQTDETASRLAEGKNIFKVEFHSTGSFELIYHGVVAPPSVQ